MGQKSRITVASFKNICLYHVESSDGWDDDKRDDFSFQIVNFPHMDSNIPANPAYGVYISQELELHIEVGFHT